ncbi:hypothetical protein [Hyphococcus luteus]|uniref:Uncharacterized protein n=1 Tax=Hyphococcus luteus TaxID=2058213 RepID=A0A2S7K624_9PROT|nr:hypothetical protein [Marinicaulis flavus]PQA87965.1 hypothetical protein CW354_06405 [Marinicaulis flavus]
MAKSEKRLSLSFETIGSIAAIVIGACALFVAWDQAQIMRKQQHASVLPVLNVSGGLSSEGDRHVLTVSVRNDGIGPAVIESADLFVGGAPVKDWPDLRDRFMPEALRKDFQSNLDTAVGILAAGHEAQAIVFSWPSNEETDAGFEMLRQRVFSGDPDDAFFGVCYCSVFDRCWKNTPDNRAVPEPVKSCERAGSDVVARLLQTISEDEAS